MEAKDSHPFMKCPRTLYQVTIIQRFQLAMLTISIHVEFKLLYSYKQIRLQKIKKILSTYSLKIRKPVKSLQKMVPIRSNKQHK